MPGKTLQNRNFQTPNKHSAEKIKAAEINHLKYPIKHVKLLFLKAPRRRNKPRNLFEDRPSPILNKSAKQNSDFFLIAAETQTTQTKRKQLQPADHRQMDRRASSRVPETALRCRDYKEKRETRSERERDNGSPAAAAVATLSATPLSFYSLCRQLVNIFSKQVGEERHARERKFLYTSPLLSRPPAPHYTFHFWSFSFFLLGLGGGIPVSSALVVVACER